MGLVSKCERCTSRGTCYEFFCGTLDHFQAQYLCQSCIDDIMLLVNQQKIPAHSQPRERALPPMEGQEGLNL